ncbi:hypothetical protein [Chitinimonas naiadis]
MKTARIAVMAAAIGLALGAQAHEVKAKAGNIKNAAFDIVHTDIKAEKGIVTFTMQAKGNVGSSKPKATGKFAGSDVFAYVWPTKLDPSEVGFDRGAGILALAVTAHPDFDDTPVFDENRDQNYENDGALWHSHWVVLGPDDACGKGALKVLDIPEGTKPKLPATWPGAPILIDSPGYTPILKGKTVTVRVPQAAISSVTGTSFDGVTAGLKINANLHNPLLCVANVFDVASGDLSLPGRVE